MEMKYKDAYWYLYKIDVKLKDDKKFSRYFFSKKNEEQKESYWTKVEDIPKGWEILRKTNMPIPLLGRIKKEPKIKEEPKSTFEVN